MDPHNHLGALYCPGKDEQVAKLQQDVADYHEGMQSELEEEVANVNGTLSKTRQDIGSRMKAIEEEVGASLHTAREGSDKALAACLSELSERFKAQSSALRKDLHPKAEACMMAHGKVEALGEEVSEPTPPPR